MYSNLALDYTIIALSSDTSIVVTRWQKTIKSSQKGATHITYNIRGKGSPQSYF